MESLERLQDLHADLVAFTETRLANIDRLWQELENTLDDFRKLLDVPTPTPAEKDAYNNQGKPRVWLIVYALIVYRQAVSRRGRILDQLRLQADWTGAGNCTWGGCNRGQQTADKRSWQRCCADD